MWKYCSGVVVRFRLNGWNSPSLPCRSWHDSWQTPKTPVEHHALCPVILPTNAEIPYCEDGGIFRRPACQEGLVASSSWCSRAWADSLELMQELWPRVLPAHSPVRKGSVGISTSPSQNRTVGGFPNLNVFT